MENLNELIEISISKIEEATDFFYQHKDHEGYLRLDETIGHLMKLADGLKDVVNEKPDINVQEFLEILTEAMNALEEKDTVLLSDILQYDLTDSLHSIREQLG